MKENFLISDTISRFLEDHKITDVKMIDLKGKSTSADYMVIGTGTSTRQINAVAELLAMELKNLGIENIIREGDSSCDWVLIDIGSTVVHLFKQEMRAFYNLEELWASREKLKNSDLEINH